MPAYKNVYTCKAGGVDQHNAGILMSYNQPKSPHLGQKNTGYPQFVDPSGTQVSNKLQASAPGILQREAVLDTQDGKAGEPWPTHPYSLKESTPFLDRVGCTDPSLGATTTFANILPGIPVGGLNTITSQVLL